MKMAPSVVQCNWIKVNSKPMFCKNVYVLSCGKLLNYCCCLLSTKLWCIHHEKTAIIYCFLLW